MRRFYSIYPNYDVSQDPVGRVEIFEPGPGDDVLARSAIIPAIAYGTIGGGLTVHQWGFVPRTQVDTTPESLLGEPMPETSASWSAEKTSYVAGQPTITHRWRFGKWRVTVERISTLANDLPAPIRPRSGGTLR